MVRRQRKPGAASPAGAPRKKHLLSGLIKCSCCGSNYTISGKDYYRCAGEKERGTCGNKVSVRKAPLETATLAILQEGLLTESHAKLFVEEYRREAARLAQGDERRDVAGAVRLKQLEVELANLARNLVEGKVSPMMMTMIFDREAEKATLEARLSQAAAANPLGEILPHPVLLDQFHQKVEALRATLDDDTIRTEAAAILERLIESVTIYPNAPDGPEAEVVASIGALMSFAINGNSPPRGGAGGCSMAVVAGTGFEPVTFRL
ncbi:hypothetical protein FOY91_05615 [Sphingomonas solaris]|uniref:Recombinase zinc beta ribbon domain-containing protein n=2 Tax=Alterirhizorhabdus solaris TaxID=2529389 RepID=A0A558R9A3_9SPHN|nr:hypothetical protein FOY91_05615 [Sphingomonas solaris]